MTELSGGLRRGLGRGAFQAVRDPAGPAAVSECLREDHRWDRQVDERAVYLAKLVRDLAMPVAPVLALLDDDATFRNALEVLEVLGRAGDRAAIAGLRRYVGEGNQWVDVLQTIAGAWDRELWDDLLPRVRARLARAGGTTGVLWRGEPWTSWAGTDQEVAAMIASTTVRPLSRPFKHASTAELLTAVRAGDRGRRVDTLRELNCRGPQPDLLAMVDDLPSHDLRGPLSRAIELLGAEALAPARKWAVTPGHPLRWSAYRVVAAHGDDSDVPALVAGWDWLDTQEDDRCGYDTLATGLARIGGPEAQAVVPRLRRAWHSPHSCERAAYLRALQVLDGDYVWRFLTEGLWDCESDVRTIAAGHAPLDPVVRRQLAALRDDPAETPEVRTAAGRRLAGVNTSAL